MKKNHQILLFLTLGLFSLTTKIETGSAQSPSLTQTSNNQADILFGQALELYRHGDWWYAAKYELVDKETTSPAFISSVQNYMKIAPILYLISIFASFFSLTVAKFIFVIVAGIYIFPNPFHRRRYKQFLDRLNSD